MRKSALFFTVFICITLTWIIPKYAPGKGELDFIKYWSASRLFIQSDNPYDSRALLKLQVALRPELGLKEGDIYETWNPPWLLLLLSPLAALPFDLAVHAWVLITTTLIVLGCYLSWNLAGGKATQVEFLYMLGAAFLFGNTLSLIRIGQVSALVLIALLTGIWLTQKGQDFLAGICLFYTSIKPHVIYLAVLVILLWALKQQRYKIFLGMAFIGITTSLAAWIIYPDWLTAYLFHLLNMPYQGISTSTFGSLFALISGKETFKYIGLLLLPLSIPLAKRFRPDQQLETINLTLACSIPFAPYGFSFDQILLLPAIGQLIFWITEKVYADKIRKILISSLLVIYGLLLWLMSVKALPYVWFFFISFLLMLVYLLAWRSRIEKIASP